MRTSLFALAAAALLGAAVRADAYTIDFDGPGSTAGAFAPIGLNIGYGMYVPTLDAFGDPIAGSEHWELDLSGGSVPVLDPGSVGWGAAPSGTKALDARDGSVLFVFDTPLSLATFSTVLDNSTLGDLIDTSIRFYNASNTQIASISTNQSTPGFVASIGAVNNVKSILLPSTAFYDNITVTPVPEPGTLAIPAVLAGVLLLRRLLRKA
jgi:hypothetical protein